MMKICTKRWACLMAAIMMCCTLMACHGSKDKSTSVSATESTSSEVDNIKSAILQLGRNRQSYRDYCASHPGPIELPEGMAEAEQAADENWAQFSRLVMCDSLQSAYEMLGVGSPMGEGFFSDVMVSMKHSSLMYDFVINVAAPLTALCCPDTSLRWSYLCDIQEATVMMMEGAAMLSESGYVADGFLEACWYLMEYRWMCGNPQGALEVCNLVMEVGEHSLGEGYGALYGALMKARYYKYLVGDRETSLAALKGIKSVLDQYGSDFDPDIYESVKEQLEAEMEDLQ